MKANWKLLPAALTVAMLALAGCGGGSGGTSDSTDMADDQAAMDLQAATAAVATANSLAAALTDTSTTAEVAAARAAITAATTALAKLSASDQIAQGASLTTAIDLVAHQEGRIAAEAAAKATADQKAMTAKAKTLKAAIAAILNPAATTAADPFAAAGTAVPTGLAALDPDGSGDRTDIAAINFGKGEDAGKIGNWSATDYTGSVGISTAKKTGSARVYTNPVTSSVPFTAASSGLTASSANTGYFTIGTAADANAASPKFPQASGTETYTGADRTFAGAYKGASGTYVCQGAATDACTVAYSSAGLKFVGTWEFKPAVGAMVTSVDANHLYFGWWLHEGTYNKADEKFAGAFYGTSAAGTTDNGLTAVDPNTIGAGGTATYAGKAAGKFAISNPLNPADDNAGHFTADAALTADFKADNSTLQGTIDAFRLNDGTTDPGWTVTLRETEYATATGGSTFTGQKTVWKIDENAGAAAGAWQAQMFNDHIGDAKADSNTTPDSVAGKFDAHIGGTHSMVGAFGAEHTGGN